MTLPVTVRTLPTPTCRTCASPLRLHASITAGLCCCHRGRCFLDHGYGCQACGVLLPDCDSQLGLCVACRAGVA